jgi:hypothetical protein
MKALMKVARATLALVVCLAASAAMAQTATKVAAVAVVKPVTLTAAPIPACTEAKPKQTPCVRATKPVKKHTKPKHKVAAKKAPPPVVAAPLPVVVESASAECLEIRFPTTQVSPEVVVTFWGQPSANFTDDACIKKNTLIPCDRGAELCNFSDTKKIVQKELLMAASYQTPQAGDHVLYVPRSFLDEDKDFVTCMARVYGDETLPPVGNGLYQTATTHNKAVAKWKQQQYSDSICLGYYSFHNSGYALVYDSVVAMPADAKYQTYFTDLGVHKYPD